MDRFDLIILLIWFGFLFIEPMSATIIAAVLILVGLLDIEM